MAILRQSRTMVQRHPKERGERPVPGNRPPAAPADDELVPQLLNRYLSARRTAEDRTSPGPPQGAPAVDTSGRGHSAIPAAALPGRAADYLQRSAGNTALQRALQGAGNRAGSDAGQPVQRQHQAQRQPDLLDALILDDWPRAVDLLNQLSDADLAAHIAQESPERLLRLQRAAAQAGVARVTQAIHNAQLRTGTQVENVEGTTFRTPVTLFRNGVVISKDIRFVKRGRFRSDDDFQTLKNRIMDAVRTRLTAAFRLKIETPGGVPPQPGDGEYTIRVIIVDNPSAAYRMNLHGQRHGRGAVGSNSGDIYELGQPNETETPTAYLAHECAHVLLGAHDEYADASAPARQVFTDHSLMGNFYGEGIDEAVLKPRHLGALVRLVSGWFPGRTVSIIQ